MDSHRWRHIFYTCIMILQQKKNSNSSLSSRLKFSKAVYCCVVVFFLFAVFNLTKTKKRSVKLIILHPILRNEESKSELNAKIGTKK